MVFDLPIYYYNSNFQTKSKNNFLKRLNKWPKFPPTSCISLRKKGLKKILNKIKIKKFEEIWFDFRISTYFSFKKKEFNLIDDYLTFYNQDSDNFDKKYKKFVNKSWWIRRYQAFQFLKFLDEKKYKNNFLTLDYLATTTINKFF